MFFITLIVRRAANSTTYSSPRYSKVKHNTEMQSFKVLHDGSEQENAKAAKNLMCRNLVSSWRTTSSSATSSPSSSSTTPSSTSTISKSTFGNFWSFINQQSIKWKTVWQDVIPDIVSSYTQCIKVNRFTILNSHFHRLQVSVHADIHTSNSTMNLSAIFQFNGHSLVAEFH